MILVYWLILSCIVAGFLTTKDFNGIDFTYDSNIIEGIFIIILLPLIILLCIGWLLKWYVFDKFKFPK